MISVKFLGVFLDPRLTWESHADYLSAVISKNTYLIRSLKNLVSNDVLISAYYGHIHSHLSYAVLCWGHSSHASRVFAVQRRCIRILAGLRYRDCCRASFAALGILTLPCVYILACLMFIRNNDRALVRNCDYHGYNTRHRNQLVLNYNRTTRARDGGNHYGLKFFNALPHDIRSLNPKLLKQKMQKYLKAKAFYSTEEFLNNNFGDFS